VLKEEKKYMSKDKKLRLELVMRNYWWPGVTKDVGKYVEKCDLYQRIKNRSKTLVGKLTINKY